MARTYNPFEGNLAQYGFGPEHLYFSEASPQAPNAPSPPGTPAPNPYTPSNNPYVNAFQQGQSSANDTRGDRDSGVSGQRSPDVYGKSTGMNAITDNPWDLLGSATLALPSLAVQAVTNGITGRPEKEITGLGVLDAIGALRGAFAPPSPMPQDDYYNPQNESAPLSPQSQGIVAGLDQYGGFSNYGGGDPVAGGMNDYGGREASNSSQGSGPQTESPDFARGGNVSGTSGGQSDKVPAMLSHGEYVIDAPTVALLGGGNNEAGAKMLDHMRSIIRKISTGSQEQPKPVSGEQLFSALAGRTS